MAELGLGFPYNTPIILGQLESGDPCTLHDVSETDRPTNSEGFQKSLATVHSLFLGAHFDSPEAMRFTGLDLSFTSLDTWMWDRPLVCSENLMEDGRFVGWRSQYRFPENPPYVDIPAFNGSVVFGCRMSHRPGITVHSYEATPSLGLSFGDECILTTCFRRIRDCQNLLSLLAGGPVALKWFAADLPRRTDRRSVQIFLPRTITTPQESIHRLDMLLPMSALGDRLTEVVQKWFSEADRLRDACALFFGTFYNPALYTELHFLSLTQALEVFGRQTMTGKYVADQDFERIRTAVVAAIPANTPDDLRTSLKSRLQWGNEFSQRKRVKGILRSLEAETASLICDNIPGYADRFVATRNYHTHYGPQEHEPWRDGDLFYGSNSVRVLLTVLLLRHVGLPETMIREALSRSHSMSQMIELYRRRRLDLEVSTT